MIPKFIAGRNLAMKIPAHEFASTVRFYREILSLKELTKPGDETPRFEFGDKILWLDRVSALSQAEIWLEILTNDVEAAAKYFEEQGCSRRDEIEALPENFKGFWLAGPSNIIHLIAKA